MHQARDTAVVRVRALVMFSVCYYGQGCVPLCAHCALIVRSLCAPTPFVAS